ncbi:hypothetical protein COB72_08105 [bacterium]|nr:MAG: hypothetical protein COB72_08105 [bacterium]
MREQNESTQHYPICPKCSYDLRGEIATWESQCSVDGQCPECGYEFAWSEVYGILGEWGSEVGWYAESAEDLVGLLVRTPMSLLRLMVPLWFFRDVNHRRKIRLGMLMQWMILVFVLMHALVSPIGFFANKGEWAWSNSGRNGQWWVSFIDSICNTLSAIAFPFFTVDQTKPGVIQMRTPMMDYLFEWGSFMALTLVLVGVVLSWSLLMGAVFLLRWRENLDHRHELGLFGRVILLSLMPAIVYFEIVRFGFGIYASTGMSYSTNWVPVMYIVSLLVLIFWQQVLWTHSVRTIWEIKRSWVINIGGCFGSFIGGVLFTAWILI